MDGGRWRSKQVEECREDITLLIHRCMIQNATALEQCLSLLAAFVEDKPKEMVAMFAPSLLALLKRYAQEFDYDALFVNATAVYGWMRQIAKALCEDYSDDLAVKYWLEDEMMNHGVYINYWPDEEGDNKFEYYVGDESQYDKETAEKYYKFVIDNCLRIQGTQLFF